MDHIAQLTKLSKNKAYFIGFDSDGCVFDSMELKHKECFCPAVIKHMGVQSISKAAREVWEFVNLYSKTRGCNRFQAIRYFLDILRAKSDVRARNFKLLDLPDLSIWLGRETKLGNAALKEAVAVTNSCDLQRLLDWSMEVNARVADMNCCIAPFPFVREVLEYGSQQADMIVVSQTPLEALHHEWTVNEMMQYISMIAGQEHGTKTEHIRFATEGKGYALDRVLMVGDAPGDYKAAAENRALYYPIIPGNEEASWKRLAEEGLEKFFSGAFAGDYQRQLIEEFDAALPENPCWS